MAEINFAIVKANEAEARKNGGRPRKYSERDTLFYVRLVRDGTPRWKVCQDYSLPKQTLFHMIKRLAPDIVANQGGKRQGAGNKQKGNYNQAPHQPPRHTSRRKRSSKIRQPIEPGTNVLCPACHPPKELTPENANDLYEAGNQLHQETDGNGVVSDVCYVCGYNKRLTPIA